MNKRPAEEETPRRSKKPRDMQLRECFMITALEGGGEQIVCKYCPDYNKTLQKFNPTKSRTHLTDHCPGVDDGLRQILLSNTQAAKASMKTEEGGMPALPGSKPKRGPNRKSVVVADRLSPTYLSFYADQTTSLVSTFHIICVFSAPYVSHMVSHYSSFSNTTELLSTGCYCSD